MAKKFIGAGVGSGLIAGIVTFAFARFFIEPQVAKAIDYEAGRSSTEEALEAAAGHGHAHEHGEVFTRTVQENIGAGLGTVVFALCMGAFFAIAFTLLWTYMGNRYPQTDPRWVAAAVGAIGFVTLYAAPFFVYPANPPAVGRDDTIGTRSGAFLAITLTSVSAATVAVIVVVVWLRPRMGGLKSAMVGVVGYLIVVAIAAAILPDFDEVPGPLVEGDQIRFPGFPADVLGDFRIYTIASQAILWLVIVGAFSLFVTRISKTAPSREPVSMANV